MALVAVVLLSPDGGRLRRTAAGTTTMLHVLLSPDGGGLRLGYITIKSRYCPLTGVGCDLERIAEIHRCPCVIVP